MSRVVISAADVREAQRQREKRLVVPSDAIVTPLAWEEADRLGIELMGGTASPQGGAGAESARHVPTCDPDDLERVVERVRTRVPGADAARVREIARRVLERWDG